MKVYFRVLQINLLTLKIIHMHLQKKNEYMLRNLEGQRFLIHNRLFYLLPSRNKQPTHVIALDIN